MYSLLAFEIMKLPLFRSSERHPRDYLSAIYSLVKGEVNGSVFDLFSFRVIVRPNKEEFNLDNYVRFRLPAVLIMFSTTLKGMSSSLIFRTLLRLFMFSKNSSDFRNISSLSKRSSNQGYGT